MTNKQKIVALLKGLVSNKEKVQKLPAYADEYSVADFTIQPSWGICIFVEDNLDCELKDYVSFLEYPLCPSKRNPVKSDGGFDFGENIYLNEDRWLLIEWVIIELSKEGGK